MSTSRYVKRDELPNPRILRGAIRLAGDLPNDAYIIGVPKNAFKRFDTVGNEGSGLDTLHSFTFPPLSLKKNGDHIVGRMAGTYANNDNDKRVVIDIGGVQFEDGLGSPQDIDGQGAKAGWTVTFGIGRIDSTHLSVYTNFVGEFIAFNGAGSPIVNLCFHHYTRIQGSVTVSNLDSNNLVILAQGEGVSNNDVQQTMSILDLTRF